MKNFLQSALVHVSDTRNSSLYAGLSAIKDKECRSISFASMFFKTENSPLFFLSPLAINDNLWQHV